MKSVFRMLPAVGLALGLASASAQQQAAPVAGLKPASPACMATARELLQMKNAGAMFASAVPNIVHKTKEQFLTTNLNYQKDLNEVELIVAQKPCDPRGRTLHLHPSEHARRGGSARRGDPGRHGQGDCEFMKTRWIGHVFRLFPAFNRG